VAEALVVDVVRGLTLEPLALLALAPAVRALGAAPAVGDLPQRHGRAHEGEDDDSRGVECRHRLVAWDVAIRVGHDDVDPRLPRIAP
jgi:hypothetical protein